MEAGPRKTAHSRERDAVRDVEGPDRNSREPTASRHRNAADDHQDITDGLTPDGPEIAHGDTDDGGPGPGELAPEPEVEVELRPPRRLRIWHLAPIVALAAVGSLMFAFPLAFEFGDGGAVVAMLGLLICSCAAGWAVMAARRAGSTWPGLPQRGSGRRPDWRVIALYAVVVVAAAVLAVWRVARLR